MEFRVRPTSAGSWLRPTAAVCDGVRTRGTFQVTKHLAISHFPVYLFLYPIPMHSVSSMSLSHTLQCLIIYPRYFRELSQFFLDRLLQNELSFRFEAASHDLTHALRVRNCIQICISVVGILGRISASTSSTSLTCAWLRTSSRGPSTRASSPHLSSRLQRRKQWM